MTSFTLAGDPHQQQRRRRSSRPPCVVLAILSLSILAEEYAGVGTFLRRRNRASRRRRDGMTALQTRASSHTCGLSFGWKCSFGTRRLPQLWWRGSVPFSFPSKKWGISFKTVEPLAAKIEAYEVTFLNVNWSTETPLLVVPIATTHIMLPCTLPLLTLVFRN